MIQTCQQRMWEVVTNVPRIIQAGASPSVEEQQACSGLQHQRVPDNDVLLCLWVGNKPTAGGLQSKGFDAAEESEPPLEGKCIQVYPHTLMAPLQPLRFWTGWLSALPR